MNKKEKKKCISCQKLKHLTNDFHISYSELHGDKRVPVCKLCLYDMYSKKKAELGNEEEAIKQVMQYIDKPFLYELVDSSKRESPNNVFGAYIKNVVMPQYKGMTWKDSKFRENSNTSQVVDNITPSPSKEFVVTEEIIDKWGYGYTLEEYRQFEKKYKRLIQGYGEKTAIHTENLLTYIRYRVKEEMATARGDVKEAKEWGALAAKAAEHGKLNVSQLSKSDISGGVDVLSQLFEAVETEASVIPLLPKLLEQPYDDADLIIWATVNYNRRLEDKPPVSYREIWKFYDEMLEEYFSQQGFDEKQIQEFKARRNNVFRDLEQVYREPLYESDGE